jgi:hypothetical protein
MPCPALPCLWSVQVLRAGRLLILSVPGELTTMAGRRLKRAVQAAVGFPAPCCAVLCCAVLRWLRRDLPEARWPSAPSLFLT